MRNLAPRAAKMLGAAAVIALLAFGAFQARATATSLDHCGPMAGPDIHCESANECSPHCPNAQIISCVEPETGPPYCCMCIY